MKALWGELWDECPWDEYMMNKCPIYRTKPPGMKDPEMKPPPNP